MNAARTKAIATGQLITGSGFLRGVSLSEVGGTAAYLRLWDNTSASGTLLATFKLAAGSSVNLPPDGGSIYFATGVFVELVSGTLPEGSVFIG